jgi:CheY-like chemotaxis protein
VKSCPDIIITDLSMPIVDGWETIRRLRADQRTRSIPIIVCTGLQGVHGVEWPWVDPYLLKPCSLDALMLEVRRLLPPARAA